MELRNLTVSLGGALANSHKIDNSFKRSLSGLQTINLMVFALSLTTPLIYVSQPYLKTMIYVSLSLAIMVGVP